MTKIIDPNNNGLITGKINTNSSGGYYDFALNYITSSNLINSSVVFIAKLDISGNQVYFKIAGNPNSVSSGINIIADQNGNALVTGQIQTNNIGGYYDFASNHIISSNLLNSSVAFVAKLDPSGNQVYFKIAGNPPVVSPSTLSTSGNSIVADQDGNAFVTGQIQTNNNSGYYDFASNFITSGNIENQFVAFVAKLDISGNQSYFKIAVGSTSNTIPNPLSDSSGNSIIIDKKGNALVTGTLQTNQSIDYYDFASNHITTNNLSNSSIVFIAKLDSSGDQSYFKIAGNPNSFSSGKSISVDQHDNAVITGQTETDMFGNYYDFALNHVTSNNLKNSLVAFVSKIDASGNQCYFKIAGNQAMTFPSPGSIGNSIDVDRNGNALVTGQIFIPMNNTSGYCDFASNYITSINLLANTSDNFIVFVAKLDFSGNQLYFKIAGNPNSMSLGISIVADKNYNAIITGQIQTNSNGGYYDFASNHIISSNLLNSSVAFVAKFDISGNQCYFKIAGNSDSFSIGINIVADKTMNVIVFGPIQIDSIGGYYDFASNHVLSSNLTGMTIVAFVSKLNKSGNQNYFKIAGS